MDNEAISSLVKVWSIIFASLCYCYFIVSKIPIGKFRLISTLPILCLYIILPLYFSTILLTGTTAFFITWLCSFKLILFSFNLGPLTTPRIDHVVNGIEKGSDLRDLNKNDREPIKSFSKFIFIAAFPIKGNDTTTLSTKVIPLNFWSQTLISALLIVICDRYKVELHPGVIIVIYCVLLYLLVDILVSIANMLVGPMSGLEIVPPSDEPYLSTSLQDFWGKRWNLMVTDTLRHTIYLPTRAFSSKYVGKGPALVLAYTMSFLVSGLVHELIFYYMTRVTPSWEVTWFFVLHGFCVILEVMLKKVLGRKMKLHWVVTGPLTIGFVMGTARLWFFPPIVNNQVDLRTIEEFKTFYELVKGMFVWPL